jgi:hypothetical protein
MRIESLLIVGGLSLLSCALAIWVGYRHRTLHPRDPEDDRLEHEALHAPAPPRRR